MNRPFIVSVLVAQLLFLIPQGSVYGQSKDLAPANPEASKDDKTTNADQEKSTQTPKAEKPIIMDFTKKKESETKVNTTSSVAPKLDKQLEDLAKQQTKIEDKKEIERAATAKPQAAPKKKAPSLQLFGRIEQISQSGNVKMPVLKAMTPKLDPREKKLQAKVEQRKYSGKITSFFPRDFQGTWGGTLQVWNHHWSKLYLKVDRQEAIQTAKILKKGRKGKVNFVFYRNSRGRTSLRPAEVLLSVPMKDTYSYSQMMKGSNTNQMAPFGNSFNDVMANMEMPMVKINFGTYQTDGVLERGVSGNQAKQTLVKNVIRQLAPNVLEQQIITKSETKVKGTNRTNTGYAESVLRFKKLGHGKMYVLAASVNYTSKGGYLDKLIMYGNVQQGRQVQTNPMGSLNSMMGNMMNMQKMFGMPTGQGSSRQGSRANPFMMPGGGQMQGLPKNFNPNDILRRMNKQYNR